MFGKVDQLNLMVKKEQISVGVVNIWLEKPRKSRGSLHRCNRLTRVPLIGWVVKNLQIKNEANIPQCGTNNLS